jgi:hypothetical protein
VAEIVEEISSSEYVIDSNVSRFTWMLYSSTAPMSSATGTMLA